ncbi:hypothetical protein TYRP_019229 [Tyrophagus putrescentiae]|nr:hypothetical protein TYRP_019229 [Tyrophagus putrescentiae]
MTFIMKKKKYKFSVTLTVEDLSNVPFINSVLFVKCRLLEGGSFEDFTDRREVDDHCVKWNKTFVFTIKTTANTSTGILDSCVLRLSIRKETKGGKSYVKLGYYDLNLPSLAGAGHTICRGLLEGYDSKHRQDNSMIQVSVDIKLLAGDPCFKTPKATCLTQKQGSTDVLNAGDGSELESLGPRKADSGGGGGHRHHNGGLAPSGIVDLGGSGGGGLPGGPSVIFGANGELSHSNQHQHSPSSSSSGHPGHHHHHHLHHHHQHSGAVTPLPSTTSSTHNNNSNSCCGGGVNGGGSAFTYHFDHHNSGGGSGSGAILNNGLPSMTSSATSNTNSVGSGAGFDPFETGHSRSNSSQTSSSRISCTTGFNSLPSHSRQGSADSENTGNARHQAVNEIKFNSVDRVVGGKRSGHGHHNHLLHEASQQQPSRGAVKAVNGGGCGVTGEQLASSKAAIDSTRVSADQLVQQLLADNKLAEALTEESPIFDDAASGLYGLGGGGLALYVGKDGSATIGSRTARQVAEEGASASAGNGGHHHAVRTGSSGGSGPGSKNSSGSSTPNRRLNRV